MTNMAFSDRVRDLQLVWDSTSLGELKSCPRRYLYSIVKGYRQKNESVHLTFGILYHQALEMYDKLRAEGTPYDEAVVEVVRDVMKRSVWWASADANKNRETLLRTVVWYLDQFKNDTLETIVLANGKAAVELTFRFETDILTQDGQAFELSGHIDKLARLNGVPYVVDRKTTKNTIGSWYFDRFSPDNQFTLYTLAARHFYNEPVAGLIVDAAQVGVEFSRFQRALVSRSQGQLDEWYAELSYWLGMAKMYARKQYWPMNDKACFNCQFRTICAMSPGSRDIWLDKEFDVRPWDPTVVRGDI